MMKGKKIIVENMIKIIVSLVLYGVGYVVISRNISAQYLGMLGTKYESETSAFFQNVILLMAVLAVLYIIWFVLIKIKSKIRIWIERHAFQSFIIALALGVAVTLWLYYRTGMVSVGNSLVKFDQILILGPIYGICLVWCSPNNVCSVIYPGAQRIWSRVILAVIAAAFAAWIIFY